MLFMSGLESHNLHSLSMHGMVCNSVFTSQTLSTILSLRNFTSIVIHLPNPLLLDPTNNLLNKYFHSRFLIAQNCFNREF